MSPAGTTRDVDEVLAALGPDAARWLDEALTALAADPVRLPRDVAAAARVARQAGGRDVDDPWAWQPADALRARLLLAVPPDAERLGDLLLDLDRHGDAGERRAVLRALPLLDVPRETGRRLVLSALRANDPRLVAAALGPYGVAVLDDDELAQAVLKAVFLELDVRRVPGLTERATPALSARLLDLALERVVAGRALPAGVWAVVQLHPDPERLAALRAELDSPLAHRRQAAAEALRDLAAAGAAPTTAAGGSA